MQILQDSPVDFPLLARSKVRDLYDPGDHLSTTVTDRFSSLDAVRSELIFNKGEILESISTFFFEQPAYIDPPAPIEQPAPIVQPSNTLNKPADYPFPLNHNDEAFVDGS